MTNLNNFEGLKIIENKTDDKITNEDYVVKCIGAFGTWQARVCAVIGITRVIVMWNTLSIVFLTYDTTFTCTEFKNISHNVSLSMCYDDCVEYEFDDGVFVTNFLEDFGLICDSFWLASFTQTLMMFGGLLGGPLFGWISDRYGRRKAFILAACSSTALMVVIPFSPNYWIFTCLRFFVGMTTFGVIIVGVVIIMEMVGPQHREIAGCCISSSDGLSEAILAVFAYFSSTWRIYLTCCSIVSIFIPFLMILVSETPMWLLASGRLSEVRKTLTAAAEFNKRDPSFVEENIDYLIPGETKQEEHSATYSDLLRTKNLAKKTILSLFIWISSGLCFYGINQYATFLGSNVFTAVIILGLIQIPANFIGMWLNKSYGRKRATMGTFLLTGISMIILTFIPSDHWTAVIFGVTGTCSCSTTFCIIYVYVSELFPTPLRNMAFGIGCSGAKLGAMVAPFIVVLKPSWVPSLVFTAVPFFTIAVCFCLPETKGRPLQDKID